MKVMVISTSFPGSGFHSGQEAAGSFVHDFVQELALRADVHVVAPGKDDCINRENGFSVKYFTVPRLPLSLLKPGNPGHWTSIAKTFRNGHLTVETEIESFKPDHVLSLWALPSGLWAQNPCRKHGIPYSVWALGSDIWSLGKIPIVSSVLRVVLRRAMHCFADGHNLAEDVKRLSGRSCTFLPSCRKLPLNGVKNLSTAPPYRMAFLGRWHSNKGIDILLKSLDLLTDDDWTKIAEVRIHGGGPMEQTVHEEGASLMRKNRPVRIGGYLNLEEATALYQWADYILIPSRIESIPVVFSDSMQSMCPVIAMPVGDLPRLINEMPSGFLAGKISIDSYSNAIRASLLSSPIVFSSGLSSYSSTFSIDYSVDKLIKEIIE